jgi:hypothetical protein
MPAREAPILKHLTSSEGCDQAPFDPRPSRASDRHGLAVFVVHHFIARFLLALRRVLGLSPAPHHGRLAAKQARLH